MTFKNRQDYIKYLKNRPMSMPKKSKWSDEYLNKALKEYEIIKPRMPLQDNARYGDWKITFERYFHLLRHNSILIGSSLGGIFLAKYLSEHKFPKKIKAVYLIAAPYDNSLPGEDLVGGFKLKSDLTLIEKNCKRVVLMFSKYDDVVPVSHAEKFRRKLRNSEIIIYKHIKGHFKITKFPEIVKHIRNLPN